MVAIDPSVLAEQKLRPLLRHEYDRLVAAGAFEDERIELLRGFLVEMTPIDPPHAYVTDRLFELLVGALAGRARVRGQNPFAAGDHSEPQPDLAVVPVGDYLDDHPSRAFLLVEVADSSVRKDRLLKGPLYALAGVDEYWIVNLAIDVIEIHRGPQPDGTWRATTKAGRGESIALVSFPDVQLAVDDVLPRKR